MRLWESTRGLQGSFLVLGLVVMLLGVCLTQSLSPKAACSGALQNLTQPQYQDITKNTGAGFMAALVQSFLHTVQPNPFPGDYVLTLVTEFQQMLNQNTIKEGLMYDIGFLVCAAIGILYIVLMPIVGFFLACCRCCGNCGGKMYQKQTSSIDCRRRTLYWCTFFTTVIILAGNICMFKSNEDLKVTVDQSPAQLNITINNINTFVTAVPQQVNYVVNESSNIIQSVRNNLDAIGPQLGEAIKLRLKGILEPTLNSVSLLAQETVNISVQLNTLNSSLAQLQSSLNLFQNNLTNVRNRINNTLSNPNCTGCGGQRSEVQKLTLDTSVNMPGFNTFQSAVDEIIKINLTSKVMEVNDFLGSIPQKVTNDTKNVVQSIKQQLSDIQAQISQVTSKIPLSALTNFSGTLNTLQTEINKFTPDVERAEFIRWSICIAISCVVLLVIVCNVLGLVLGPLGRTPRADPTKRSCTSDCGGTFLMMGAGFSFLFSWLFMIVVLLLFLLGGNVYTLVCQPWSNGQLLKFIDTSGLIPNLGQTLGLKTNLNISNIYIDCEQNQPVWTTLHLYELVNLEDLLNVSKYTAQIQQQFDNTNVSLSSITLLSSQVKNQLRNFSSKAIDFDTTTATQQMNNITSINLNTTAVILENISATMTNNDIKTQLQNEARDLRQLQINLETVIIPQMKNLNSTIRILQSTTGKINRTVGEVLNNVGIAQDFLNTNTTQIIKIESRIFLNCQLGFFTAYADWANLTITKQVGRCLPVAGAVDSVEMILCSQMVESLNAFWFSLGWCLIFFIPGIIFSIKLAKYYRRMKHADVYENPLSNQIIMTHIPRAQMKVT